MYLFVSVLLPPKQVDRLHNYQLPTINYNVVHGRLTTCYTVPPDGFHCMRYFFVRIRAVFTILNTQQEAQSFKHAILCIINEFNVGQRPHWRLWSFKLVIVHLPS